MVTTLQCMQISNYVVYLKLNAICQLYLNGKKNKKKTPETYPCNYGTFK